MYLYVINVENAEYVCISELILYEAECVPSFILFPANTVLSFFRNEKNVNEKDRCFSHIYTSSV